MSENDNKQNITYQCPRCLNEIDKDDKFCKMCGYFIDSNNFYQYHQQPEIKQPKKKFSFLRVSMVIYVIYIILLILALCLIDSICTNINW